MRYPAIYQSTVNGNAILLFSDKQGVVLDKHETVISTSCGWVESAFTNITAEHLANTYGEVKSKEHAEFIVELALNHGIEVVTWPEKITHFNFQDTYGRMKLNLIGDEFCKLKLKQITIPLPPESNVNTPEEDFEMTQVAKNNGDNLIFGGADKREEWPCVNDEVLTSDGNGVVRLLSDSKGYYVVSINGEYYQYQLDELSKPKTPKEELRELLSLLWKENNHDFDMFIDVVTCHVTKKPQ